MSTKVKTTEKARSKSNHYFTPKQAEIELTYRVPMRVTTIELFRSGDTNAVCPRCQNGLNREYISFCDICGQKLSWHRFSKAEIVRVP